MSARSLGELLDQLEAEGQVRRVSCEVSCDLEIAEITCRMATTDGPALLFENVAGRSFPVLTNVLGADRRICACLGAVSLAEVGNRLAGESKDMSGSWLQRLKAGLPSAADEPFAPRAVRTAACQQVVKPGRDVDLNELPALRAAPQETGPVLTGVTLVSSDVGGDERQADAFDLPILDRNILGIRWSSEQPVARHFASFAAAGDRMPVAIVLGAPPAVTLASYAMLPGTVDVFTFAGLMAGAPVEVVTCRAHGLQAPAEAEFVLEGFIDPAEQPVSAATMATSAGTYCSRDDFRRIEIVQITHRAAPVMPAVVPTRPPNEALQIVRAVERIFLTVWQQSTSELVDFARPAYAAPRDFAVAAIQKSYPHQARKVASALWGQAATMRTRFLIIVDEHVNVREDRDVWFQVAAHADPEHDVFFQQGPPDGSNNMAIDATRKLPGERAGGDVQVCQMDDAIRQRVSERWGEYGLP